LPEENQTVITTSSQPEPNSPIKPNKRRLLISQFLLLAAVLLIGMLLYAWKPWQIGATGNQRTITITGEAKITAEPDKYTFRPEYDYKAASQQAALQAATVKANEVVAKLKSLGVPSSKIKTDSYGYDSYYDSSQQTYRTYLEVVVDKKDLAQKVQDYLLTTSPQGSVTPQAEFSDTKTHQLESEGRDKATKDARAKAEQSARNLDFKLGKIKTFVDNPDNGFGGYIAKGANSAASGLSAGTNKADSLAIQQGENSITYQVKVTYFLK
jgi:uncharacterized protein YggE